MKNSSKEEASLFNNNTEKKNKNSKKRNKKDKQILKKEAYELRAKMISKDLKPFNFSRVNLTKNEMDITENLQNGDSYDNDKIAHLNFPQKRSHEQAMGRDSGVKRRR